MSKYKIWYMKPSFFPDGILGYNWLAEKGKLPNPEKLEETHVFLTEIEANGPESVYYQMQGDIWSPNGEARELIEQKGLHHTSMSMGDIAVTELGEVLIVDRFGFKKL